MMHGRIAPAEISPFDTRYQGRSRLDPLASGLVLLITLALLVPMILYRAPPEVKRKLPPVEVVNLELPPPPPPPASPPPPRPTPVPPAAVHAPRPLLDIPARAPQITVQPDPVPPAPAPAAEPAPPSPPSPPSPPRTVSAGDISASMIHAPPPSYPRESRRQREEGTVVLSVRLGTDGSVAEIGIARSSGHRRLDEAARAAVRKWRWRPTVRDGVAVEVRGTVAIPFVLSGSVRE